MVDIETATLGLRQFRQCGGTMLFVRKFVFALIGLVVGAALVLLLEGALLAAMSWLFGRGLVPRGIGWIAMPIVGGALGAQLGWIAGNPGSFSTIRWSPVERLRDAVDGATSETRLWLAFATLWLLGVVLAFLVFDPFGRYYWSQREWLKFLTVLLGPVILALLGVQLFHMGYAEAATA